ncbi:hypothetical protein LTR99_007613 [Exophiala xenobiotica]|uniref:C2H2-type domain-containing protein n=1 Tax=Vermiconidia calcicola TaxID=1690605 RepID=A0AAV9Q407_9PEZI|nr:hypothetical protein H2202_001669 [Exophiala xenobiotica]KAK5532718.1 hypothetical protein LTR23_009428 [Chaetothyriales sp. CCFEE 6169]KAK5534722.1 hypothetical protein LTR25_006754 [Vermiconidia calcicola]KAK5210472.1 hypothetical protein LTR41_004140 [Exophiala xenobiotica]KAK5228309.1 hypothetical protein LTR72_002192 [Exophiala xenobiotica]
MAPGRQQPVYGLHPAELFHYSHKYRVVICTICHYAIPRPGIAWHLKELHHFLNPCDRRPYLDFVAKLDLCEPDQVARPSGTGNDFPVPELPVYDGLQCGLKGCSYLCTSEKRLKNHWATAHPALGVCQQDLNSHRVPVQTFFRGNKLSYFSGPLETTTSSLHPKPALNPMPFLKPALSSKKAYPFHTTPSSSASLYGKVVTVLDATPSLAGESTNLHHETVPSCDTDTLSLLQHYQASTSKTIDPGTHTPNDNSLWGEVIFQIAHEHKFLLHGILALTCLHLAYLNPVPRTRNKYLIKASEHQGKAMPLFRKALAKPNDNNCHAILVFCCLLIPYTFASEQQDELFLTSKQHGNEADIVPTWLYFIRNGCIMLSEYWDLVEDGPCESLAKCWDAAFETGTPQQTAYLNSLHGIMAAASSEHAWSEQVCAAYLVAAKELATAFACSRSDLENYTTWDALRVWPTRMSMDFTKLLHDLHPAALILLAHYAILLEPIEVKWYFEGRATKLLKTISQKLDPYWHFALPHM